MISSNYPIFDMPYSGFYNIGCIVDSMFNYKRTSLGFYTNFNTFGRSQISYKNRIEGFSIMYLQKFKYKRLDAYVGPSFNYRFIRISSIYHYESIEKYIGVGIYSSIFLNLSKWVSFGTETNFYYQRFDFKEIDKNTGAFPSNTKYKFSQNKYFSTTLLFNF